MPRASGTPILPWQPAREGPGRSRSTAWSILPEVYIGGGQARVEFAGLAPGFAGVYELNVVAPDTFINNRVFLISHGRRSNST